jgi:guanylate kinase
VTVGELGTCELAGPQLIVVSGRPGAGKSSVIAELVRRWPELFVSVPVTTRVPRPGEEPGEYYHFVDRVTFDRMIERGEFLEYAEYAGNFYGTPAAPIRQARALGQPTLLEIEVQSARQIRAAMPDALLVMLVPPLWEALDERLPDHGREYPAAQKRCLRRAPEALDAAREFDATVVNDDLQRATQELITLIGGTPGNMRHLTVSGDNE